MQVNVFPALLKLLEEEAPLQLTLKVSFFPME